MIVYAFVIIEFLVVLASMWVAYRVVKWGIELLVNMITPMGKMIEEKEGYDVYQGDNVVAVGLWYPLRNGVNTVEIDLVDVRAARGIRVTFSHARNEWVILQPILRDDDGDKVNQWVEVGSYPAYHAEYEKEKK